MNRRQTQITLRLFMIGIACLALNLWLFRIGWIAGFIGLNLSKHVVIAYLCQTLGVDRNVDLNRASSPLDERG